MKFRTPSIFCIFSIKGGIINWHLELTTPYARLTYHTYNIKYIVALMAFFIALFNMWLLSFWQKSRQVPVVPKPRGDKPSASYNEATSYQGFSQYHRPCGAMFLLSKKMNILLLILCPLLLIFPISDSGEKVHIDNI